MQSLLWVFCLVLLFTFSSTAQTGYQIGTVSQATGTIIDDDEEALPLEWLAFTANATGQNVQLDWLVGHQTQVLQYYPQWSPDGINWSDLGTVAAQTQRTQAGYQYLHLQPKTGTNFYRIQQADNDGLTTFSNVVTVEWQSTPISEVHLFPNPTIGTLNLELPTSFTNDRAVKLLIFDQQGQLVQRLNWQANRPLELHQLAAGTYQLVVQQDELRVVSRFIKLAE